MYRCKMLHHRLTSSFLSQKPRREGRARAIFLRKQIHRARVSEVCESMDGWRGVSIEMDPVRSRNPLRTNHIHTACCFCTVSHTPACPAPTFPKKKSLSHWLAGAYRPGVDLQYAYIGHYHMDTTGGRAVERFHLCLRLPGSPTREPWPDDRRKPTHRLHLTVEHPCHLLLRERWGAMLRATSRCSALPRHVCNVGTHN